MVSSYMSSRNKNGEIRYEAFLDYSGILKIIFRVSADDVSCDFECTNPQSYDHLSGKIIENLRGMSSVSTADNGAIWHYSIRETLFITLNCSNGEIHNINKLTSFEVRSLAQGKEGRVPFSRKPVDFKPRTDLHTHYTGAFTPDQLIETALRYNIFYPVDYLAKAGVDIRKYQPDENGSIKLTAVNSEDLEILKSSLMISPFTQETFNKMEESYLLRSPIAKHKGLLPDLLFLLAESYRNIGVEYAELSFSSFIRDPEYMELINIILPQIESETGVRIRFIASLWRHSCQEWNMDDSDRIVSIAESPYIVGADFMGHETNSTEVFKEELCLFADYAMKKDPYFTIRVHAGETPMVKRNVKDTLRIVYEEHAARETADGCKYVMPRVRIGHGLYGLDDETIRLAREMEAVIEFNISSNLALNNVNSITEVPIKKYIDAGVDVVLGTDGGGLFSTIGEQETLLAAAAGLEPEDFEKIKETEAKVLAQISERERGHPHPNDVHNLYKKIKYSSPNGKPRYSQAVFRRYAAIKAKAEKWLETHLEKTGVITDPEEIIRDTEGKTPVVITGSSEITWPDIAPEDQEYIGLTMQVLVDTLNAKTAYLVTGGTNYGVEKKVHEAVHRRNTSGQGKPIVCLGTFTMEATENDGKGIEPDTITHAVILEHDGLKVENWKDLPETQLVYAKERDGYLIAAGGGSIVNDMIQRGYNLDVKMHLMDGPYGASTKKSRSLAGNDCSFNTAEELLSRLYYSDPGLFDPDFGLEHLNDYMKKARKEMKGVIRS